MKPLTAILLVLVLGPASLPAQATGKPLNVVLIMADDSAADNYGCYGSKFFKTPRLDALAAGGAKFNKWYSEPVCTSSRVKIMTGRDGIRNYVAFGTLDRDEITFGTMMKKAGYATAVAGKWQLHGGQRGSLAPDCGFDTYCLWNYPGGERPRYWKPSIVRDGKLLESGDKQSGPDVFTDVIIEFIGQTKDEQRKGEKAYATDGGTHAPLIVSCPGTVSKGVVSDDLVDFSDMLPTIAGITGAKLPEVELDGRSFWPQCQKKKGNPRQWIFQYYYPKFVKAAKEHGQGVNGREIVWAQNQYFKLYRDGKLYAVKDRHEVHAIPSGEDDDADSTRAMLQGALDSMPKKAAKLDPKAKRRKKR